MSADGHQQISTADTNNSEKFDEWFQLTELDRSFRGDTPALPICRDFLKASHQKLARQFQSGTDIEELIQHDARAVILSRGYLERLQVCPEMREQLPLAGLFHSTC